MSFHLSAGFLPSAQEFSRNPRFLKPQTALVLFFWIIYRPWRRNFQTDAWNDFIFFFKFCCFSSFILWNFFPPSWCLSLFLPCGPCARLCMFPINVMLTELAKQLITSPHWRHSETAWLCISREVERVSYCFANFLGWCFDVLAKFSPDNLCSFSRK